MNPVKPCCTPGASVTTLNETPITPCRSSVIHDQVTIPAGCFAMGDATGEGYFSDGETPVHEVEISAFDIDVYAVTNAQFAQFVTATGYTTVAEQTGYSAVFHDHFTGKKAEKLGIADMPWWWVIAGANWRNPHGSGSAIDSLMNHPVVHISYLDATAYCTWAQRLLPTEAQWEYAARGGLDSARYPWGQHLVPQGRHQANVWQGSFPDSNDASDGWQATAPVDCFEPNGFGVYQMAGNVWEWCVDWFNPLTYETTVRIDPCGPSTGKQRVLRGGSFLCHHSYCNRYRVSARSANAPNATASNMGFRTVAG